MKEVMRKHRRNFLGSIVPLFAISISAFVGLTALSADLTYAGMLRSTLERAVDASVRAGRQSYKKLGKDPGLAINDAARVFKMNVANQVGGANIYSSTGYKTPTTLTYNQTFTTADGISNVFSGQPVSFTVTVDITVQKITVTASVTKKDLFLNQNPTITISRFQYLTGTPKDIVLLIDLAGQQRNNTIYTFVGRAKRDVAPCATAMTMFENDVVLFQAIEDLSMIAAFSPLEINGWCIENFRPENVFVNSPGVDIPTAATYNTAKQMYVNDATRGWITNNNGSNSGLYRVVPSGYTITELAASPLGAEDKALANTFADNSGTEAAFQTYYNRAAAYIEPHASLSNAVTLFKNEIAGSVQHSLGLITYDDMSSSLSDRTSTMVRDPFLKRDMSSSYESDITIPYVALTTSFSSVSDALSIVSTMGAATMANPLIVKSFPRGQGTMGAISDALTNAATVLTTNTKEGAVVLYAASAPSSFPTLGTNISNLVMAGNDVYSIILTSMLSAQDITDFTTQIEGNGGQPIRFVSDPVDLDNTFLLVAEDLT